MDLFFFNQNIYTLYIYIYISSIYDIYIYIYHIYDIYEIYRVYVFFFMYPYDDLLWDFPMICCCSFGGFPQDLILQGQFFPVFPKGLRHQEEELRPFQDPVLSEVCLGRAPTWWGGCGFTLGNSSIFFATMAMQQEPEEPIWLEVPIPFFEGRKMLGLNFREYPQKIWPTIWYVYVPPLNRILKFPLKHEGNRILTMVDLVANADSFNTLEPCLQISGLGGGHEWIHTGIPCCSLHFIATPIIIRSCWLHKTFSNQPFLSILWIITIIIIIIIRIRIIIITVITDNNSNIITIKYQ